MSTLHKLSFVVFSLIVRRMTQKLDHAVKLWDSNPSLAFMGGDERLGGCF